MTQCAICDECNADNEWGYDRCQADECNKTYCDYKDVLYPWANTCEPKECCYDGTCPAVDPDPSDPNHAPLDTGNVGEG